MNEAIMAIEMNSDEHDIAISAVNMLLDAHYAIYDYTQEDTVQVAALKSVREKMLEVWKTRFESNIESPVTNQ